MARALIDTNVLIYAFEQGWKAETARAVLASRPYVSVQGLTEFVRNARRKLEMSWTQANAARDIIVDAAAQVIPITLEVHREALRLTERYRLNLFDGQMLAAALAAQCDLFWSEDLQDGLVVDGRLRIVNPFSMN